MMRTYRHWTESEKITLEAMWGNVDLADIAKAMGRTPSSVCHMAYEIELPTPSTEHKSFAAFWKASGYSPSKIKYAIEKLGIKLERARRSDPRQKRRIVRIIVTQEQQDAILNYLSKLPDGVKLMRTTGGRTIAGLWGIGRKPDSCVDCHRNDKPHVAKGRCSKCSKQYYRQRQNQKALAA